MHLGPVVTGPHRLAAHTLALAQQATVAAALPPAVYHLWRDTLEAQVTVLMQTAPALLPEPMRVLGSAIQDWGAPAAGVPAAGLTADQQPPAKLRHALSAEDFSALHMLWRNAPRTTPDVDDAWTLWKWTQRHTIELHPGSPDSDRAAVASAANSPPPPRSQALAELLAKRPWAAHLGDSMTEFGWSMAFEQHLRGAIRDGDRASLQLLQAQCGSRAEAWTPWYVDDPAWAQWDLAASARGEQLLAGRLARWASLPHPLRSAELRTSLTAWQQASRQQARSLRSGGAGLSRPAVPGQNRRARPGQPPPVPSSGSDGRRAS